MPGFQAVKVPDFSGWKNVCFSLIFSKIYFTWLQGLFDPGNLAIPNPSEILNTEYCSNLHQ